MHAWRTPAVGALAAALMLAPGCGGDDDGDSAGVPPPVAKARDFPAAAGQTIAQLRTGLPEGGLVLAPTMETGPRGVLEPGRNRFAFGIFDSSRAQIADVPVALYVARAGRPAKGPFTARYESLAVDAQFQSAGVRADPDSASTVYVSDLQLRRPGKYELLGVVKLDDRLVAATPITGALTVTPDGPVPEVGERAPRTSTPTLADVGGDIEQIDTRTPPSTMHDEDFADVLGRKPAVLLFATPALCQSRVCGPVVDIAEQVKSAHADEDIAWIHMEIFNDNTVEKGYRPQILQWRLPSEPWVFTVDRNGRVAARIEGAFSAEELENAVTAATRG